MASDTPEPTAAYTEARRAGRDAVAERLLDLADARLAAEGPAGISMRRLANAAGCSTMVFYTAFGTKAGLLTALAQREAERWIDEALTRSDPDPVAWLEATGFALLAAAVARPHHRDLVLAPASGEPPGSASTPDAATPGVTATPGAATTSGAATTLGAAVEDAVRRAWPGTEADGGPVAAAVWAAWRGALMLEPAEAARVLAGTLRLWAAAVREAQRGDGVVA